MILAISISVITIVLVIIRPRPLNEGTAAALGAIAMLAAGVVSAQEAFDVLKATDNILLFFVGLMVIGAVADQAGFFKWCAQKAVRMAGSSARRLLLVVFGLGVLITTFFSNDATALILTPIIFVLVTRLRLNPLPYVFACAFIANTASMILPVSNPVNLLLVDTFKITLDEYLKFTLMPSLVAIVINIVIFMCIFRRDIAVSFEDEEPQMPIKIDGFFYFVCVVLVIAAIGYVLVSLYAKPVSWPALGGAAALLCGGFAFRRLQVRKVVSGLSWSILIFIFSLALIVRGLENREVTQVIGDTVARLLSESPLWAIVGVSFGTAIGANLVNNWSMMMISVSSLSSMATEVPSLDRGIMYSTILGADLGPNITILGSLSSMLWLVLLRQRGLDIHPLQYLKLGLIVTPPMLIAGALCLYACGRLFG